MKHISLITMLSIIASVINLLLLFPTPFEQTNITVLYNQQQIEKTNSSDLPAVEKLEINKNVNFMMNRKINEIWIEWSLVAFFCIISIFSIVAIICISDTFGHTMLYISGFLYILIWAITVNSWGDANISIVSNFIESVLNEYTVDKPFWMLRFFLIYCFNPIIYIYIIVSITLELFQKKKPV